MTMKPLLAFLALALLCTVALAPALAQAPDRGAAGRPDAPAPGLGNDGPPPPGEMGGPERRDEGEMKRKMEEWKKGRDPKEVETYMKAVERIRVQSEIWIQMARVYMDTKNSAKALETLRKVLAMEIPEGPLQDTMLRKKNQLYLMASDMALKSGDPGTARTLVEEGVAQCKDAPEVAVHLYKRLAEICTKEGKPDEALKALEQAAALAEKAFK